MTHPIYLIIETGMPRDHHALFVETHEAGPQTGHLYHVIGNIQEGMQFEHRVATAAPETSPTFERRVELGAMSVADYDGGEGFLRVCERVPVPEKQFQGPKRLYPERPLRRCQEWAREVAEVLFGEDRVGMAGVKGE